MRPAGSKKDGTYQDTAQLTVPAHLARRIPQGTKFLAELVEEGILFRVITDEFVFEDEGGPDWLRTLPREEKP